MPQKLATQIQESVRAAAEEVLSTASYASYLGRFQDELRDELSASLEQEFCLLASSGTAALELALRGLGVGKGDEVLLSAYDYPGNFWAIERIGARPVLVDTGEGWNINESAAEDALSGADIKAVVVSHLHGQIQNMPFFRTLCQSRNIALIEDNCQSFGAQLGDASTGSFGDAAIVSFGGGKLISCGRGGAVLCRDETLAQRMKIAAGAGSGPYTMSELQCAVARAQMSHMRELAQYVRDFFLAMAEAIQLQQEQKSIASNDLSISIPWLAPTQPSFYQAGFQLSSQSAGIQEIEMAVERATNILKSQEIRAGSGFSGFHRRSKRRCRIVGTLDRCPTLAKQTLVIHHSAALHERISASELARIVLNATAECE